MPGPRLVLHYYPAHFPPEHRDATTGATLSAGLLIVFQGKTVVFRTKAWGGPSRELHLAGQPSATPTPAGEYILTNPAPYTTRTWKFAEVKWGTPVKPNPDDVNDVLYELPSRTPGVKSWGSTKRAFGLTRRQIEDEYAGIYGRVGLPSVWVFNPFGPLAVRFFKDRNGNRRFDRASERLEGAMFHTTPENEADTALGRHLQMGNSHGCIHMKPRDRDALIGLGALKAGVQLVIHSYTEHYGAATH